MSSKISSWFSIISLILTIKFISLFQPANGSAAPQDLYNTCNKTFTCGDRIRQIRYPFRGTNDPLSCGHPGLVLGCDHSNTTIEILNVTYYVWDIDQNNHKMRIQGTLDRPCLLPMENTTLDFSLFNYANSCMNITLLYGCHDPQHTGFAIPSCRNGEGRVYVVPGNQGRGNCEASVIVPVDSGEYRKQELINFTRFGEVLENGFEIMWKFESKACSDCVGSNGRCGIDLQTNHTTCLCRDQPFVTETCPLGEETSQPSPPRSVPSSVPGKSSNRRGMQIGLSIAGAVIGVFGIGLAILYLKQRSKQIMATKSVSKELMHSTSSTKGLLSSPRTTYTRSIPSYQSSKSDFGSDVTYFGVQVFNLSQLQEATDNFNDSRELGDGGFGTVYYGELPDGCKIAVKRLYNNNFKRVEQFMNEVEILARLRHKHLVKLYGCTPKHSRELLLVYEYIPNGTVADHLHGNRAKSSPLSWPVRLNIAIETAHALIYLHKSDIIHRDVKTCNILLDNDFHVKVADFGLSRLFPTDVTHVSTAPQGTPGYVDPEYYQCYQLTEKSDVYSFGVVLVELISSLQAVDTNRHRHDINLSTMAMNKIQNHKLHELVDSSLGFGADSSIRRMTTLVAELGFRCLQQERDMRPSMDEVLESLIRIENEDLDDHMIEIDIFADEEDIVPLNSSDVSSSPD